MLFILPSHDTLDCLLCYTVYGMLGYFFEQMLKFVASPTTYFVKY